MAADPQVPSDVELLRSSREEPGDFGVFYDRHAGAVLAFCIRRTGCMQTAADLTGEVFAASYAKRSSFQDTGAPARAWLYAIARRQIAMFHRRNRVVDRYRRRFGISPVDAGDDDFSRVEELVDLEPILGALNGAMAALPDAQAHAVRLRIVEQLPYSDVARGLGCSEGAARVRVSRALTRLAETLEEP